MDGGAGVGDDGAAGQGGDDAAPELAVLLLHGGGQADEALAPLGQVGPQDEVQLAAGAGDVLEPGALRVHLTEQVHVHRVVDGDEVVQLGDDMDVVGVVHRGSHDVGVVIHVVVELLRARTEGEHLPALVQVLVLSGDLARPGDVHEGVHIHLGVDPQVPQVGLGDHGADGVGHTADAQLEAGPVGDLGYHQAGHGPVHVGGLPAGPQLGHRRVVPLHHAVHVPDVDLTAVEAVDPGQAAVDLQDDVPGLLQHVRQLGGGQAEVEVAVAVHGGDLEHGHVHLHLLPVEPGELGVAHGDEVPHALGGDLAVDAAHVPGVPGKVLPGVLRLGDLRHPHSDAALHLHVVQLVLPGGQGPVQGHRVVGAPAVVHPVPGLHQLHRILRGGSFFLIKRLVVHGLSFPFVCMPPPMGRAGHLR